MTCSCITQEKKLRISIQTAIIAFIIFNPWTFQFMRGLFGGWVSTVEGCPKTLGILIHTALFGLVIFLSMKPFKNQHQSVPGLPLL